MDSMRYYFSAQLHFNTPLHIGAGLSDDFTDLPVYRNANSQLLIPGSSLAGVLRGQATRLAPRLGFEPCKALYARGKNDDEKGRPCGCQVCKLFGDINPVDNESTLAKYSAAASKVWIYDAVMKNSSGVPMVRDHVGIQRQTGTANRAAVARFDQEVISQGAIFILKLQWSGLDDNQEILLASILAEWLENNGRGNLGGGGSRGLGSFSLLYPSLKGWDFNEPEHLMAYLENDDPWDAKYIGSNEEKAGGKAREWLEDKLKKGRQNIVASNYPLSSSESLAKFINNSILSSCWVSFDFTLQAEGPFLTNDLAQQALTGFDHAPLMGGIFKAGGPVLPGSSLRGAMRSQAEKILRTLSSYRAGNEKEPGQCFLDHCPACDPLIRGDEDGKSMNIPLESCDSLLTRNGIKTEIEPEDGDLCLACQLFGSPRWGSRLRVEDASLVPNTYPNYKALDFLAIDRFTGGGLAGAKFDALALWKPAFQVRILIENPQRWELGLLALVLRDLEEDMISVGFGASKGFGKVKANNWKVTFDFLDDKDLPFAANNLSRLSNIRGVGLYRRTILTEKGALAGNEIWNELCQEWLKDFQTEWQSFVRSNKVRNTCDSYFGTELEELYPLHTVMGGEKNE